MVFFWGPVQVTVVSCYHLHALSLLSYLLMEANAALNMTPGHSFRGGLPGLMWRYMLCTLCPYLSSVACEVCLRRAFLRRYQAVHVSACPLCTSPNPDKTTRTR